MFNKIDEAISFIESQRVKRSFNDFKDILIRYNIKTDLKNVIHVTGTNGKGSTVTFMKGLLLKKGYHVGTFTSPYIIKHNERIAVDGKMISDDDLLRLINQLYPIIVKEKLSMFEIDTLIMLVYFNELSLDYHIIECGIGGLYDKTNVVKAKYALITNIGYDHQFMLGNELKEIASHKVGIVKEGSTLFTTENNEELLAYFKDYCTKLDSKLEVVKVSKQSNYPYHLEYNNETYCLSLPAYQVNNLALALNTIGSFIDFTKDEIEEVIDNFYWPCRFEYINGYYLDGAHNIDGIKALVKTIKERKLQDVGIVFSALGDKNIKEMLDLLCDFDVCIAGFEDDRSVKADYNYQEAIELMSHKHQNIIITGSLHFVSTVRKYLLKNDAI